MRRIDWHDIEQVAAYLRASPAAVAAVLDVECGWPHRGGFSGSLLRILWERHKCWKHAHPSERKKLPRSVCNRKAGGYARTTSLNWSRLKMARSVMGDRAYLAASYGLPQILGENYRRAGYKSVVAMVDAFYSGGEPEQLWAMARFIEADKNMLRALQKRRWATFARLYNGRGYKRNRYDKKLAKAYKLMLRGHPGADKAPPRKTKSEREKVVTSETQPRVRMDGHSARKRKAAKGIGVAAALVALATAAVTLGKEVLSWVSGLFW